MHPQAVLDMRRLLDRLYLVETPHSIDTLIDELLAKPAASVVSFLNQHAFNLACDDESFRLHLASAHVLLRDGVGVEVSLRLLGRAPGQNVNGTDLIPRILERAAGRSIAVFGTREPWLGAAIARIREHNVRVVAWMDGFQADETYLEAVARTRPDIVLLGMGMPRQEALAAKLADAGNGVRLVLNGGAILDFYGQRFPRAPLWMRRARLEWAFRLALEPQRLASRYIHGGWVFLWRLASLKTSARRDA
jgi:N-acetylglucosaminyldiphosphoundecaprenol N-acetyl-beta-D-mannosaminyltransferase